MPARLDISQRQQRQYTSAECVEHNGGIGSKVQTSILLSLIEQNQQKPCQRHGKKISHHATAEYQQERLYQQLAKKSPAADAE